MNDDFYAAFESIFRGSRDLIKARAGVYVPLLAALNRMFDHPAALDLGCGRGEWLEVLIENDIAAAGVDLDDAMLAEAAAAGADVVKADALSHLCRLPDDSLALVTAFHLVEHIPFNDLKALVKESLRVLKPGGILVMETPNPENPVVAATEFYLDPTHQRPIPPKLLSFVPQYFGFARVAVLRLRESCDPEFAVDITLNDVLEGVSPDYAVAAQKAMAPGMVDAAGPLFDTPVGVDLKTLTARYDAQTRDREVLEKIIADQAQALTEQARARAKQASQLAEQARRDAHQVHTALAAVHDSLSWRITWPLRTAGTLVRLLVRLPKRGIRALVVRFLKAVLARPGPGRRFDRMTGRFPGLRHRLQILALSEGLIGSAHDPLGSGFVQVKNHGSRPDAADMTPEADSIFQDLNTPPSHEKKDCSDADRD